MRARREIKAVWDSDLKVLLENLGVIEPLIQGDFICIVCDNNVDLDNLGAIIPDGNQVSVTCNDTRCVRAVTSREMESERGSEHH